ncbi:hypothetical protein F8S09_15490 [Deinococcus sp. SDU3-2]|uniref:Uncharacterized protein n=1 Tax=Deinococcus terrestris TaxID=2651870 RepID=A0A7X1NYW9_9DEIO|nr:hypothetical protein [Deinococcus terrestris]MPY68059.1 hypothetical protein [Deinococcus terrestris]
MLIPDPRDLSAAERLLLAAAQQRLRERQQQAREFSQGLYEQYRPHMVLPCLEETPSKALIGPGMALQSVRWGKTSPPPQQAPSRPAGVPDWSPVVERAVDQTFRQLPHPPRPGTPEARAAQVVQLAEPILRERLRRRMQVEREAKGQEGKAYLRTDRVERNLRVLGALAEAAYTLIGARGQQAGHITSYTYFTVLDVLPIATGLSTASCERATRDLRACGLLATWSDWTTAEFLDRATGEQVRTRARTGVWVCLELRPEAHRRARIFPSELPRDERGQLQPARDLEADRRVGRTAWQARKEVRESSPLQRRREGMGYLVQWALSQAECIYSVVRDSLTSPHLAHTTSPQELVWSLQAVLSEHPQRRGEVIGEAAQALTRLYRDPGSFPHYCRMLWRASEAEFRGVPAFRQLEAAMLRTLVAMREVNLRRPGAYLLKQLERAGWLESVYRKARLAGPGNRSGPPTDSFA